MAKKIAKPPIPARSGISIGKALIYLTTICIIGVVYVKFFKKSSLSSYSNIPKEVQLKYIPSDFVPSIDEENALVILSNPYRYNREFNQLIYDFNLSLLYHVANRMNLSDTIKSQIKVEYEKHHPYLRRLYFNDFVALKDTSETLYNAWYEKEGANAVEALNEVASKYTCFLVNDILATLLKTQNGKLYVKGSKVDTPCGVAMMEGLQPMIKRLKEKAAVEDFSRAKGLMEEKVEKAIAELATMEVRDKKGINRSLQTKIWGFNVSSTDLEVSAISILKVGFKLNKYFDIQLSSKSGTVTVTLPEPEILSHEVYPKIDKLDIGWLREVKSVDLNQNLDLLRKEFRRDALNSDIMDKAKKQAARLMEILLTPLIKSISKKYLLKVRFKNVNPQIEENVEAEPFGKTNMQ